MRVLSAAAVPQNAVCEALNLSLRPTPAISQLNGSAATTTSTVMPAPVSIQEHNMQRALYHHRNTFHQSSSSTITLVAPFHNQFKCENEYEEKVHPDIVNSVVSGAATTSDTQIYNSDSAIDLVCASEKKPFAEATDFHGSHVTVSFGDTAVSGTATSAPVYKTKVYPCPECLKVFRHPMSLHHHRHVHKGTYTCQSCGKVFSRRWDLHRHIHRSKMGCRRPNHSTATPVIDAPQGITTTASLRSDHPYDLNNPPSN